MSRRRWAVVVQMGILGGLLACLVLFRDRLPEPGDLWAAATGADPGWLAVAVAAQFGSMAAFALLQRRLLRAGGHRLGTGRAYAITYAANALAESIPAGAALGAAYTYRQYRRSGAETRLAMAVMVLSGLVSIMTFAVLALLGLLLVPGARLFAAGALFAVAVAAGLALLARRFGFPRRLAFVPLARTPRPLQRLIGEVREGWRAARPAARDLLAVIALACFNWLLDMVTLVAVAASIGLPVPAYAVAAGFFAAQLAGMFPLLPGGLGAVEGSLGGALIAFGVAAVPAAAAVFLYRVVSYWLVVAAGWLAWLVLHVGREVGAERPLGLGGTASA